MSYDDDDAARDAWYEKVSNQAVDDFMMERLRSYYVANPAVMRPAVDALLEAQRLYKNGHYAATVLFSASCIEILLKITILKPVFYGLVHNERLADVVVEKIFGKTGYDINLLGRIFSEFVNTDIKTIVRDGAKKSLMEECNDLRTQRNKITHSGASCSCEEAALGITLATVIYEEIVRVVLYNLGLHNIEKGMIVPIPSR